MASAPNIVYVVLGILLVLLILLIVLTIIVRRNNTTVIEPHNYNPECMSVVCPGSSEQGAPNFTILGDGRSYVTSTFCGINTPSPDQISSIERCAEDQDSEEAAWWKGSEEGENRSRIEQFREFYNRQFVQQCSSNWLFNKFDPESNRPEEFANNIELCLAS